MPEYQPATLNKPSGSTWRFIWYNRNPKTGTLERVRNTLDINRIRDLQERERCAALRLADLNTALRNGYNYFVHTLGVPDHTANSGCKILQPELAVHTAQPEITIVEALERALRIRLVGKKERTISTYKSMIKLLCDWLKKTDLAGMAVSGFTAEMFQEYLCWKSEQGHGNGNLNDHMFFFKTTFDVVRKKLRLIVVNPVADFEPLPEGESTLFAPLTPDEIERIVPVLIANNPRFYLYTRFIAHEYIRPWHVARLQARDIAYGKATISVADETTKNRKARDKQLLQPIRTMLIEMGYHKLPGHYYLFGNKFEPAAKNDHRLSITAAEVWKKLVIDGLGINKKMYALKHTASQYYVNENDNADLKFLQQQMEHHSLTQTEVYLQNKVHKRIDEKAVKTMKY